MKTVVAALIVALAIVFHAVAPEVFREAAPPTEIDGWVESANALVCPTHITFREYMTSQMGNFWADHDDPISRGKTNAMIKERALQYRDCEELVPGKIVSWIPVAPIVTYTFVSKDDQEPELDPKKHQVEHKVVLIRYSSEDGVEKRGYTGIGSVRSLNEADEPSE